MAFHKLKTWPQFFESVVLGDKTFEVRKDDRGYQVGDTLLLEEWNPDTSFYTGRAHAVTVTYIARRTSDVITGAISDGYVIMSVVPHKAKEAPCL